MLKELYQKYLVTGAVTIDSRHVPSGALFFAIRGPRFNGNSFAEKALEAGASYVIIDDPSYKKTSSAYILVEDSLLLLKQLALYHRMQYGRCFPIIAVTGSYGKTTTKELIYRVLRTTYRTVATRGNLNTAIGVALTLLSMREDTEVAVIEMGATRLGDIALCCQIACPTYGLITAIGEVHLEGFGHLQAVIQGKNELYDYLYARGGTVFVNRSSPLLRKLSERFIAPLTHAKAIDFIELDWIDNTPYLRYRSPEGREVVTHLLGRPNLDNAAAALSVAAYFNVPSDSAHQAIKIYVPDNQRMELMSKGSNQLIVDSYNASPASVQAALSVLLELRVDYRVVILGDMAELGDQMAAWHHKIVAQLRDNGYNLILLCGVHFAAAAKPFVDDHRFYAFPDKESLATYVAKCFFQNSGLLIKGSRALDMSTLIDCIKG